MKRKEPPCDSPAARSLRILVADDNDDAAGMLASFLTLSGHEVAVASGGLEALELAARFRPQVALLDIGMPGIDGYVLAQRLRGEAWSCSIQLIALTGWGQPSDRKRAMAAGFDAHFTKPVDLDALNAWMAGHPARATLCPQVRTVPGQ